MTYRLNVCNLSGIFEKSFGLTNFSEDYYALLNSFRGLESAVNDSSYTLSPRTLEEYLEYKDWYQDYRLFCKLSHFVDDFNFFINESVRTRTEHDSKHLVDRRLHDFIRRVESMKIPQQTKDTIAGFLKMQRAKVALVAIRESPWVVPNLLENENLQIIAAKAKNEEVRKRLIMTTQILQTWGKFPELRLGQLISNSLPEGTDLFYSKLIFVYSWRSAQQRTMIILADSREESDTIFKSEEPNISPYVTQLFVDGGESTIIYNH